MAQRNDAAVIPHAPRQRDHQAPGVLAHLPSPVSPMALPSFYVNRMQTPMLTGDGKAMRTCDGALAGSIPTGRFPMGILPTDAVDRVQTH